MRERWAAEWGTHPCFFPVIPVTYNLSLKRFPLSLLTQNLDFFFFFSFLWGWNKNNCNQKIIQEPGRENNQLNKWWGKYPPQKPLQLLQIQSCDSLSVRLQQPQRESHHHRNELKHLFTSEADPLNQLLPANPRPGTTLWVRTARPSHTPLGV